MKGLPVFNINSLSREKDDLLTFLMALILVFLTWLLIMQWRFSDFLVQNDAVTYFYIYFKKLFDVHGDWTKLIYSADLIGGIKVHEVNGTLPQSQLFSWLGVPPRAGINCTIMLFQICYAFIGLKSASGLAAIWKEKPDPARLSVVSRIGLIWLFAFAPVFGWRIIYGHINLVAAMFFYLGILSLIISLRTERLTITETIIIMLTLVNSIPTPGQQILLYGAIFGAPVLLVLLFPMIKRNSDARLCLLIPVLLCLGALAVSMPKVIGMIKNAMSMDANRSIGDESIIFSYTTATVKDWLGSISWVKELFSTERDDFLLHETNYPFGPLVLLLALIPWKKAKALGIAMLISAVMAVAFSMNIYPVPEILTAICPLLNSFRVPARAIIPFALTFPIFTMAGLLSVSTGTDKKIRLAVALSYVIMGAVLLFIPPAAREIMTWTALSVLIIFIMKKYQIHIISKPLIILVLACACLSAFKERLLPYIDGEELDDSANKIKAIMYENQPALMRPLTRIYLGFTIPEFYLNQGVPLGLSTLDGYSSPPARFSRLFQALLNQPIKPTDVAFRFKDTVLRYPVMRNLYNISHSATIQDGRLFINPLEPTPGEAWLGRKVVSLPGFGELASVLMENSNNLPDKLKDTIWVVSDDPDIIRVNPSAKKYDECINAKIVSVESENRGQRVMIRIDSPGQCPLVVSMNYMSSFNVTGITSYGEKIALDAFPAYGALTGVIVPAPVKEVIIESRAYIPLWSKIVFYAGLLMMGGGLILAWIVKKKYHAPSP